MNESFVDFLKHVTSQKEASLMIAKDANELSEFKSLLINNYFKQANHISQLLAYADTPTKIFFVLSGELSKDVYDFIVQYPTGQIEIFDKDKAKWLITKPNYQDSSIIFILTKEDLDKIQQQGFQLLENAGITYQA